MIVSRSLWASTVTAISETSAPVSERGNTLALCQEPLLLELPVLEALLGLLFGLLALLDELSESLPGAPSCSCSAAAESRVRGPSSQPNSRMQTTWINLPPMSICVLQDRCTLMCMELMSKIVTCLNGAG